MEEMDQGITSNIEHDTNLQATAMNDLNKFDNKMKSGQFFGAGDDSSSEEESNTRPMTELEILRQKNSILMDKLYKA